MPLIVSDWLTSPRIAVMSPAQEGAFIRLLLCAWNEPDCTLPDDDEMLAELSRLRADWPTLGKKVRACFVADPERPGRIYNEKQRQIRAEQDARVFKARQQRQDAANSRWGNRVVRPHSDRNATASRPQSGSNASYSYSSTHTHPTKSYKASAKALTGERKEIADRFDAAMGDEYRHGHDKGKWIDRIKADWKKCRTVIGEVESAIKENRIKTTPAAYAEDFWKRIE